LLILGTQEKRCARERDDDDAGVLSHPIVRLGRCGGTRYPFGFTAGLKTGLYFPRERIIRS
jgi:hypothetical protein